MFALPDLPYAHGALQPTMSERTLRFHHDKHHATYVDTLNKLLDGAASGSLEDVIRSSAADGRSKVFNNAAQAWNHAFFWNSMSPYRSSPEGDLAERIQSAFGGVDKLRGAFVEEGIGHFGSGWVWLTAAGGELKVESTHDAHDMVTRPEVTPLLVCDLWEHAYYLDFQNDRKGFLQAWVETLANWSFASSQWAAASSSGEAWRYPAAESGPKAA